MPCQVNEKVPMKPDEKIQLLTSNDYIQKLVSKRDRLVDTFKSNFKALDSELDDQPVTERLKAILQILVVTFDIYCLESMSILRLYKEAARTDNYKRDKGGKLFQDFASQLAMYKAEHDRIGDEFEAKIVELTDIIQAETTTGQATSSPSVCRSLTLQKIEGRLQQRKLYYESFIKIV